MRIALLVDANETTGSGAATDAPTASALTTRLGPLGRVVLLPDTPALAAALACYFQPPGGDDAATVLVAPIAAGAGALVPSEGWSALGLGDRVGSIDVGEMASMAACEATEHLAAGALDLAHAAFSRADALLGGERSTRRAEVLAGLARVARGRELEGEACARFDEALAIAPELRGVLRERIELARATGDVATAAALRRKLIASAATDEERIGLLVHVADDALEAATDAMRAALALRPGHRALLGRLRAVHEAAGDFGQAVDAQVALAEATQGASERARAFVAAAELCAQHAGGHTAAVGGAAKNVDRAVALYEAAIADDPAVPGAFEAIEGVLLAAQDFSGAERAYARQLERLRGRGLEESEALLLDKLAKVRSDKLGDWRGAVQALDGLVVLRPEQVEPRARLAAMLETNGEDDLAVKCLEIAAHRAPTRAATFHSLHRIFARAENADRAYAACGVLVHLGEADLDEQRVYQHFAPKGALQPTKPLDDAAWMLLHPEDHDRVLSSIVSAIAPAAVAMRIEKMRSAGALPKLDSKARHDPETSTVSAVRTVAWAAKFLGVKTPEVYARAEEVASGITLVAAAEPSVAIGKSMLSGRSVPELTFRIAWELAYERITGRLLQLYASLPELSALIVAAIAVIAPPEGLDPQVAAVSHALAARLDSMQRFRLDAAVKQLVARGGKLDLLAWLRSIERTACRAGLVASGDITVAARLLAVDGRAASGLTAADRIKDLIPFSVSDPYARLRRAIGVAITGKLPAPASSEELEVAIDF